MFHVSPLLEGGNAVTGRSQGSPPTAAGAMPLTVALALERVVGPPWPIGWRVPIDRRTWHGGRRTRPATGAGTAVLAPSVLVRTCGPVAYTPGAVAFVRHLSH